MSDDKKPFDPNAFFEKFPDVSRVAVFDNEKFVGFSVGWAEKGTGFGSFVFAINKETLEPSADLEGMGPESVTRILQRLIGTPVETFTE